MDESSNKSLVNIIKNLLEENKKSWHNKLINALSTDRLTTKKSIAMSPYQLVYGMDVVFPSSLGVPVMKIIQELQVEPNDIQRRIDQSIQLQQSREEVYNKSHVIQENIKKVFERRTKANDFNLGDKVLKWDSRREDKGKHGKFDNLWIGPYIIHAFKGHNSFSLKHIWNRNARWTCEWQNVKELFLLEIEVFLHPIIVNIIVFIILIGVTY